MNDGINMHRRYQIWISQQKQYIHFFFFGSRVLTTRFLCKSGVESVSGWRCRQENAKKKKKNIYINRWRLNSSPSADTEAYIHTYIHHFRSMTRTVFIQTCPQTNQRTVQCSATHTERYIAFHGAQTNDAKCERGGGVAAYNSKFFCIAYMCKVQYNIEMCDADNKGTIIMAQLLWFMWLVAQKCVEL